MTTTNPTNQPKNQGEDDMSNNKDVLETPITVEAVWEDDDNNPTTAKEESTMATTQPQPLHTTLEEITEVADAIFHAKNGDHKYVFLKDNPDIPVSITADTKNGQRVRGKYYKNTIQVIGDFYQHNTIIDETGDFADIIVVDNIADITNQWEAYQIGGTNQFTHLENRADDMALYSLVGTGEYDENGVELMEMVLMSPEEAIEELMSDSTTSNNKVAVDNANQIVADTIIGQEFRHTAVLEVTVDGHGNLTFVSSDKVFGGTPFFEHILKGSNWDLDYIVIQIEKSQVLKSSLATEFGDETPYTDAWLKLSERLAAEHGNPHFPFAVVATDNGFTLIPKPLASLFVQFASAHTQVVEYLKVLCQLSIGITEVTTLISEDLYFKAPEDHEVRVSPKKTVKFEKNKIYKNNTDGMSMIKQELLTNLNISKNDGVQFRALSAETVEAMRSHDWKPFCDQWREYFASAKENAMKALLTTGVDWMAYAPAFEKSCVLSQVQHQSKFDVKIAKATMDAVLGQEEARKEWKRFTKIARGATGTVPALLAKWYYRNAPTKLVDFEIAASLFSKGAATPSVAIHKQVQLVTQFETGCRQNVHGVDMITPRANFKCHGKVELKKLEKGKVHLVKQYVAIINPVSGGSMVTTPHCFEAGGSGLFEDMSEASIQAYKTTLDKFRDDLIEYIESVDVSATTKKLKPQILAELKDGKYPQPIDLQAIRVHCNANQWLNEEMSASDYPGNASDLIATTRGCENLFRSMSKEMSNIMIQGPKRATNVFKLLHMCAFVGYDEVGVPAYLSYKFEAIVKCEKQPIQSTTNVRMAIALFAFAKSWYGKCLISMGYSTEINVYFGCEANCVLDWFADDDGDVLNVTFILKANLATNVKKKAGRFNGIVSVILCNVKMARLQRVAAELEKMPLSILKSRHWLDTSIPGATPLYKSGTMIGLFVNQSSLSNNAGHLFSLPVVGIDDKNEFAITFNVFCTQSGQVELDAKKHDMPNISFMQCHTQRIWNDEQQRWEVPAEVIKHIEPWCQNVRNGVPWDTFTLNCGKVVINPFSFDIKEEDGQRTITYNGEQWTEDMFTENLLWCNRDVLEKWFGGTPEYVGWFEKLLTGEYNKHNYVTHYKSGNRFVTEQSLKNRVTKVGNGFVTSVSPLAPVTGKHAGLFADATRLATRSGFGVNIATDNPGGPDYRYLGDETLVSVSHKIMLKTFWMKWERSTGISAIAARDTVENYIRSGVKAPEYYSVVTGSHPLSRDLLLQKLFGKKLSSYQIFKRIIGSYVGEDGLEVMDVNKLIQTISVPNKKFKWTKDNGSFGSEAMVDLALALAKYDLKSGSSKVTPDQLESLIAENISNNVFARLGKDIWTCFLDYTLLTIMDRWLAHTLPCEFAKVLTTVNWNDLRNNAAASQGITLKVQSLHMKVTGVAFDKCKCCKPILVQGLKSLGRKQDKVKLERFKADMAEYLTETNYAYGKPVVQSVAVPKKSGKGEVHEIIGSCVQNGSWLSIPDFAKVANFFGGFYTKGDEVVECAYSQYGVKMDRKSDSWGKDGIVVDSKGNEAFDFSSFDQGQEMGFICVSPASVKDEVLEIFNRRQRRVEHAEAQGGTKIHSVWLDPAPVTVSVQFTPPANEKTSGPKVIETPENELVEDYNEIDIDDLDIDALYEEFLD